MEEFNLMQRNSKNEIILNPRQHTNIVQSSTRHMLDMIKMMQTKMEVLLEHIASFNTTTHAHVSNRDRGMNPIAGRAFKRYCWSCDDALIGVKHTQTKKAGRQNRA